EERVAHPVLAVHVLRSHPLGDERLGTARVDWHLAAPAGHLDRVQRVLDLLLEADVAAADRDRLELSARVEEPEEEREDVVARCALIDAQTRTTGTASRSSSSALVGSPGTTPSCSTMCAPAAHPQRTASRSSAPSASANANAALKASPAPV